MRAGFCRFGISTAAAALMIAGAPAMAQTREQTFRFDVPAGNLGDGLRTLGETTHQQIIFAENSVRGKRNAALKGSYTVGEALTRLLGAAPGGALRAVARCAADAASGWAAGPTG